MQQYLDLMRRVRTEGVRKADRTGTGTLSVFGHQMRFDLAQGFPLVTTKKLHLKSIIHELIWFLGGDTSLDYLRKHRVRIWDEWAREETRPDGLENLKERLGLEPFKTCGPIYGKQWRYWAAPDSRTIDQVRKSVESLTANRGSASIVQLQEQARALSRTINQIQDVVDTLKTNPDSRRMIVSAWNPADIPDMELAPCHCLFQFYVADGRLSCQLYQRSADIFLGVPFNIASYALLTMMIAQVADLKLGEFVHTLGDAHLYLNHLDQTDLQLTRTPKPLPTMKINLKVDSIFDFTYHDFFLEGYDPHPHIKAEVAV